MDIQYLNSIIHVIFGTASLVASGPWSPDPSRTQYPTRMPASVQKEKVVVVGAGPAGALAALYAARAGNDVEVYELRGGR